MAALYLFFNCNCILFCERLRSTDNFLSSIFSPCLKSLEHITSRVCGASSEKSLQMLFLVFPVVFQAFFFRYECCVAFIAQIKHYGEFTVLNKLIPVVLQLRNQIK